MQQLQKCLNSLKIIIKFYYQASEQTTPKGHEQDLMNHYIVIAQV